MEFFIASFAVWSKNEVKFNFSHHHRRTSRMDRVCFWGLSMGSASGAFMESQFRLPRPTRMIFAISFHIHQHTSSFLTFTEQDIVAITTRCFGFNIFLSLTCSLPFKPMEQLI